MRWPKRHLLCGALGAIMAACSVSPAYQTPDVSPYVTPSFAHAIPGAQATPEDVQDQWWRQFEDPVLNALVDRALENNRSLAEAIHRLNAARIAVDAERLRRLPSGQVEASAVRSRTAAAAIITDVPSLGESIEPFDDQVAYGLSTASSWEIDVFGRVNQLIKVADLEAQALDQTRSDIKRVLIGEVVSAYVSLQGIKLRLDAARDSASIQGETLNATSLLFDEGEVSRIDTLRARVRFTQTSTLVAQLEAEELIGKNQLAVLVGEAPAHFFDGDIPARATVLALPSYVPVKSPIDLIRQRPDVRAAERRLAAETARIGVEVSNYYPRLILSGGVGLRSAQLSTLGSDTAFQYNIGPSLSLGIFDFPRIRVRVKQQRALVSATLAQFDAAVLTALEETESALVRYASSARTVADLGAIEQDTQAIRDLAVQGYEEGVIDYFQVLDAEQELVDAKIALATARADQLTNLVSVYRAFGGGVDAPTMDTPVAQNDQP